MLARPAWSQSDPAAARELLKRGYEIKQASGCKDAVPIFEESVRLDPQVKGVLNLADCEEQVGLLGNAQKHWLQARDLGRRESNPAVVQEAETHLAAIDKRFAHLTVRLPQGAPPGTIVLRNGVEFGHAALGLPLPIDPGTHTLILRARGYRDSQKEISLREGQSTEVVLELGSVESTPPKPAAPPKTNLYAPDPTPAAPPADGLSGMRVGAIALGGAGAAALVTGIVLGVVAKNKAGDSKSECGLGGIENRCTDAGVTIRADARSIGTAGTVVFLIGAGLVGGGVALWFLDDSHSKASARATPFITGDAAGASISGRF